MAAPVIVDCHSHIFNAEDLPIDGFIRKQSPLPSVLTGVLSLPLDRLASWAAPGSREAEYLLDRLGASAGLEATFDEVAEPGVELMSDVELDARIVAYWPLAQPVVTTGLESVDSDDLLVQRIEEATPEQRAELDDWLAEWGDPELDRAQSDAQLGLEGISDLWARARAVKRAAQRFLDALRLVSRHRHLIAAELASTYPQVQLFVPALVDFSATAEDEPSTSVPEQIAIHSLIAKLSVVGGIPNAPDVRCHPMVGFCPHREVAASELAMWDVDAGTPNRYVPYADPATAGDADRYQPGIRFDRTRARALHEPQGSWTSARLRLDGVDRSLDLVRHAIELGGFVGVKLYPPAGFLPIGNVARFGERRGARLDAALHALYGYCEVEEVPILTHAAHSNGFADGYDDLAAPTAWRDVLVDYPRLRVCFGHFGHVHGVKDTANPEPTSWSRRFVELIDEFPNVYADVGNSQFGYNPGYRARYTALLVALLGSRDVETPLLVKRRRRLMFGSDYWMNTLGPEHRGFLEAFRDGIEMTFGTNVRDWFMGLNALRFLGINGDDDLPAVGNLNRRRLQRFYDTNPRPAWLLDPRP